MSLEIIVDFARVFDKTILVRLPILDPAAFFFFHIEIKGSFVNLCIKIAILHFLIYINFILSFIMLANLIKSG